MNKRPRMENGRLPHGPRAPEALSPAGNVKRPSDSAAAVHSAHTRPWPTPTRSPFPDQRIQNPAGLSRREIRWSAMQDLTAHGWRSAIPRPPTHGHLLPVKKQGGSILSTSQHPGRQGSTPRCRMDQSAIAGIASDPGPTSSGISRTAFGPPEVISAPPSPMRLRRG